MKRFTVFMLLILLCFYLQAQNSENRSANNKKRFQIGLSYVFMNLDMKVHDMSISSVWQDVDFGTDELTGEEIDEINSIAERTTMLNGVMLEAGATIYDSPDEKWMIAGSLMLGMAKSSTKTYNQNTDTNEMVLTSHFTEPCFGIGFNINHQFNPKWGLLIKPLVALTFGESDDIEDNMYPFVANFTETREDKFTTVYERLNILATYTAGNFKIAVGPGFYYAQSHHEYKVERTNNSNGDVLLDEISTGLVPRSFIDGVAAFEWTFLGPLSLNVYVGVGRDIITRAGLYYKF